MEIDFLEAVTEILTGISDAELQRAFRSWIEGAERVIHTRGDFLTSRIFSPSLSHSRSTLFWFV
jgi:hypothetical protein